MTDDQDELEEQVREAMREEANGTGAFTDWDPDANVTERLAKSAERQRKTRGVIAAYSTMYLPPPPGNMMQQDAHVGNARILSAEYQDYFAWTPQFGWLWRADNLHWMRDGGESALRNVVANALGDEGQYRDINSIVGVMAHQLRVEWQEWDRDPNIAGLPNGEVLDLTTGRTRAGKADDYITRTLGTNYDPDAKSPRFDKAMEEWLPNDEDRKWSLLYDGYALTGHTSEEAFYLAVGSGRNGKSKHLEVLGCVSGGYRHAIPQRALVGEDRDHPEWMVPLAYCRLAFIADMPGTKGWRSATIKSLTGNDEVPARDMHKPGFKMRPKAKLWIGCNFKPMLRGDDTGLYDRMCLVPYTRQFREGNQQDKHLSEKLMAELPGILTRMTQAAIEWSNGKRGLPKMSEAALEAKDAYFQDNDEFSDFCADQLEPADDEFLPNQELRDLWIAWMQNRLGNTKATVFVPIVRLKEHLERHGGKPQATPRRVAGYNTPQRGMWGWRKKIGGDDWAAETP